MYYVGRSNCVCVLLVVISMTVVDAQETVANTTPAANNVHGKQNIEVLQRSQEDTQMRRVVHEHAEIKVHNSLDFLPNRSVCGLLTDEDRIFGGENAAIDEFPWLVRIKYVLANDKEVYACAGSLITNNYVITAAHCAVNLTIKEVRLGDWNTDTQPDCQGRICSDPEVDIAVSRVYIFPEYKKSDTFKGDMALLKLKNSIHFTDFIRPICLPITEDIIKQDNSPESVYWTAGWGKTEHDKKSSIKQKLTLNAVPIDQCRKKQPVITEETASYVICAGGVAGKDTCVGDSGGSLAKKTTANKSTNWFLVGVTSYGYKHCGSEGRPGLYARVTPLLSWILHTIQL